MQFFELNRNIIRLNLTFYFFIWVNFNFFRIVFKRSYMAQIIVLNCIINNFFQAVFECWLFIQFLYFWFDSCIDCSIELVGAYLIFWLFELYAQLWLAQLFLKHRTLLLELFMHVNSSTTFGLFWLVFLELYKFTLILWLSIKFVTFKLLLWHNLFWKKWSLGLDNLLLFNQEIRLIWVWNRIKHWWINFYRFNVFYCFYFIL